jgi:glycosyltransferase involved in cell wall biosynthesis
MTDKGNAKRRGVTGTGGGVVAYVSTFPPRACGIATFTSDLMSAVERSAPALRPWVIAIDDPSTACAYPPPVRWSISQYDASSWRDCASRLNVLPVDVVCIQHEFGIDGRFEADGSYADYLSGFLSVLTKPVVSTLHTVLPRPRPELRAAIRSLAAHSDAMVIMATSAGQILEQDYGLGPARRHTIPHGVPEIVPIPLGQAKRALRLEGRLVLSTFGLLSRGKGIEHAIRALPEIVERHPSVLYLVLGETHPEVRRRDGEEYRTMLQMVVHTLGLDQHVRFVDRYLPQTELISYLQATDIYLTPYMNPAQITSGTLAYALGCGKAVVSTPYLYAKETLAHGRGILAEFGSCSALARGILLLLDRPGVRAECERRALVYGRKMQWGTVGRHYARLFAGVLGSAERASVTSSPSIPGRRAVPPYHAHSM